MKNTTILFRVVALLGAPVLALSIKALEPLPFPTFQTQLPVFLIAEIEAKTSHLEPKIGSFPPAYATASERKTAYAAWAEALSAAEQLKRRDGESDRLLAVLAHLYRQGNNMDVDGCFERAIAIIKNGLTAYPDSIPLNLEASFFYLQSDPEYVLEGEKACLRLRHLLNTDQNIDVEDGLVFAYFYEGRKDDAIRQIDHFLAIEPNDRFPADEKKKRDADFRKMKDRILKGTLQIRSSNQPNQPPLRMPVSGTPAADAPVAPPPGTAGR